MSKILFALLRLIRFIIWSVRSIQNKLLSFQARKNMISVRKISKTFNWTKESDVVASVVTGTMFEGADLNVTRPFCDVSLFWDTEPLKRDVRYRFH